MRTEIMPDPLNNPTQAFWESEVAVINGQLDWADPEITVGYSHETPGAFITMVGPLRKPDFSVPLTPYRLITPADAEVAAAEFMDTDPQLSTGYDGLLGISGSSLRSIIDENRLDGCPLLIAGGISPYSLYDVLRWLATNGLNRTPVTFVDMSPLKTRTINRLREFGYWDWPGGADIVTSTIEDFSKIPEQQRKFGIVLMDIVSAYAIPNVYQKMYSVMNDPFEGYSEILESIKLLTSSRGVSLHRTLAWRGEGDVFPSYKPLSKAETAHIIGSSGIGTLVPAHIMAEASATDIATDIRGRFSTSFPSIPCGLTILLKTDGIKPRYPTQPYVEASARMRQLYAEKFTGWTIDVTRIANARPGMFFQYFLCRQDSKHGEE